MAEIVRRKPVDKKQQARAQHSSWAGERFVEGWGVLLAVAAAYLLLSLFTYSPADPSLNNAAPAVYIANWGGSLGAYSADLLITLFGLASFGLVLWLAFHAGNAIGHSRGPSFSLQVVTVPRMLFSAGVLLYVSSPLPDWPFTGAAGSTANALGNGGLLGKMGAGMLIPLLGKVGCVMLMGAILALSILWFTGWTLSEVKAGSVWVYNVVKVTCIVAKRWINRLWAAVPEQFDLPLAHPTARPKARVMRVENDEAHRPAPRREAQATLPLGIDGEYTLPPLDLLDEPKKAASQESEEALQQNARRIEAELKNFGITGAVTNIRPGPVITIYELEPAAGVKTSSIINLQDDLARAMSAVSIRIAVMPGRNVLGIELPNRERGFISLRELLDTEEFDQSGTGLTVAMGVDTGGVPTYADISKMPHSLIAGTTGSGKSVAINAFILSLLYRMSPDQLRMVMIDPKMLELSIYNDIPHLLTPVITDPTKAASALNWVVKEMENRYRMMSELGVKNLASFNARFAELEAEGKIPTKQVQTGFDLNTGQPTYEDKPLATKPLPYLVVVIDELADLMMVAGKAVEFSIARLTQMARASGIHLLVATQRPSVDVVTGLIKANIPTRISFSVASKIDSRTVLDSMGAEALLGKGDMLYLANGSNNLARLHGAFVSEAECTKVADHVRSQGNPGYIEDIFKAGPAAVPGAKAPAGMNADGGSVEDGEGDDSLFNQAVEVVAREGKASTSFLQRHLKIGYNRAADLIDRMESEGMISAPNHVGKREILTRKGA